MNERKKLVMTIEVEPGYDCRVVMEKVEAYLGFVGHDNADDEVSRALAALDYAMARVHRAESALWTLRDRVADEAATAEQESVRSALRNAIQHSVLIMTGKEPPRPFDRGRAYR